MIIVKAIELIWLNANVYVETITMYYITSVHLMRYSGAKIAVNKQLSTNSQKLVKSS